MNASVSSQKIKSKSHKKIFENIKESKWGTSRNSMWKIKKVQIKIKATRYKVTEDWCIWEGIWLVNACWVMQSVIYQVLSASEGLFNRKRIKVVLQVQSLMEIIVKFKTDKILYTLVSCMKHPFERHKISCTKTIVQQHSTKKWL